MFPYVKNGKTQRKMRSQNDDRGEVIKSKGSLILPKIK